jgi:hypothetical protein
MYVLKKRTLASLQKLTVELNAGFAYWCLLLSMKNPHPVCLGSPDDWMTLLRGGDRIIFERDAMNIGSITFT